jgi:hypothetical protein
MVAVVERGSASPAARSRQAGFTLEPFTRLARASLVLGTLAGFGVGLTLLLPVAFGVPIALPWLQLAQAHGQVQALGFAGLFIMAVGTVIFPRFMNTVHWNAGQAELGGLLLAAGVTLRALSQPLPPSEPRALALALSGILSLVGPILFARAMVRSCHASVQPFAAWQLTLGIGFGSLLLALALNLAAMTQLVLAGSDLVPPGLNDAIIHLELRGFVVGVGIAVSLKVLPQFLILRRPWDSAFAWLLPGYAVGLVFTTLGWLTLASWPAERTLAASFRATGDVLTLVALIGVVLALRLYEPAARESGRPHITNPTRLWIRLAYAWLLAATALHAWLGLREGLGGPAGSFTELSAARHALTMGFLMVLLFAMASRILPGYSGWALQRPSFLNATVALLTLGALLRVGGELLGGYSGLFGPITGIGGVLGLSGFLLFAATLWPALGHLPRMPAQVQDSGASPSCPSGC